MKVANIAVAAALTLGLLWLLLRLVSVADIIAAARRLPVPYLLGACALYTLAFPLKSLRFSALLGRQLGWRALLPVTLVHHMLNNLLPARLGELSFPFLLRRRVGIAHSATVLLASRVLDVIAVGTIFLVSLWAVQMTMTVLYSVLTLTIAALTAMSLLLLLAPAVFVRTSRPLFRPLARWRAGAALHRALEDFPAYVSGMRANLALALVTSAAFWLANYLMTALVMRGLGWTLPIPAIFLGSTLSLLTTLLPVQGLAGLGTTEGAWTAAFVALGVAASEAATAGFVLHGLQILLFVGWGLVGLVFYVRSGRTRKDAHPTRPRS